MKHFNFLFLFIGVLGIMVACTGSDSGETMNNCELAGPEIQHMVIFNLPYPEGSEEAGRFLDDGARILTSIPVVQHFQAFRQVSAKNDYNTYNNHPDHQAFGQERWNREVTGFLEIDLKKR